MSTASKLFSQSAAQKGMRMTAGGPTSRIPGRHFARQEAYNYINPGYGSQGKKVFRYGSAEMFSSLGGEEILGFAGDRENKARAKVFSSQRAASNRARKARRTQASTPRAERATRGAKIKAAMAPDSVYAAKLELEEANKKPTFSQDYIPRNARSRTGYPAERLKRHEALMDTRAPRSWGPKTLAALNHTGNQAAKSGRSPIAWGSAIKSLKGGSAWAFAGGAAVAGLIAGSAGIKSVRGSKDNLIGSSLGAGLLVGGGAAGIHLGSNMLMQRAFDAAGPAGRKTALRTGTGAMGVLGKRMVPTLGKAGKYGLMAAGAVGALGLGRKAIGQ